MQSRTGHASLFRVVVRRSFATAVRDHTTVLPQAGSEGALIFVIDDDLAIRQAMESLLTGWGHEPYVAGSQQEIEAWLVADPKQPDLIICDYRLRDHEPGIDVIRHLHRRFSPSIPAIRVTGDTAADGIAKAQASGLTLLHKPGRQRQAPRRGG